MDDSDAEGFLEGFVLVIVVVIVFVGVVVVGRGLSEGFCIN